MTMPFGRSIAIAFAFAAVATVTWGANGERNTQAAGPFRMRPTEPPVTVVEDASAYTLANGYITARVNKRSGDLVSLVNGGVEMMGFTSGHLAGYWSHDASAGTGHVTSVSIDPQMNGGDRAEVSIKGIAGGRPMGNGPGGSTIADIEIRYTLDRGQLGLYTYCIFDHRPEYPATSVGEARFGCKLNGRVFDWLAVDANRNKKMPAPEDWDHGTELNMKEARLLNTGLYKGQVEHEYDYSAVQFDIPAYGWASTKQHVGFWFINPSMEYLSGGATKVELTGHLDNNRGASPTLVNYWRGSHYGGSSCVITQGEAWTKIIGPFLLYCNAAYSPQGMWQDALARAAREAEKWPYDWVSKASYPHRGERGTVSGQVILHDPETPNAVLTNLLVGLAHPDYTLVDGGDGPFGGPPVIDWQLDAKHYEFWVRADPRGRFIIRNVRPGKYTLHAIADGVLGEYTRKGSTLVGDVIGSGISVDAGQLVDLGQLEWRPVRYGRQLWEIGVPDRTAGEFLHGDHYWQWGLYNQYPRDFPNDVQYVVGESDYHKDWNMMQVPRAHDNTGKGQGDATTWSVTFDLPEAPRGRATLRLALAGAEAPSIDVTMNDHSVGAVNGLMNTGAVHRDSDRGYWAEKDLPFDASLMKAGSNILKLTVPAGPVIAGVLYDYVRLELDEYAPSTADR